MIVSGLTVGNADMHFDQELVGDLDLQRLCVEMEKVNFKNMQNKQTKKQHCHC